MINQNMVSIGTRVTRDIFLLSIFGAFGHIQATPLESKEQVVRPFFEGCDDSIAYAKDYMAVGCKIE